jgi:hypothetical protein
MCDKNAINENKKPIKSIRLKGLQYMTAGLPYKTGLTDWQVTG